MALALDDVWALGKKDEFVEKGKNKFRLYEYFPLHSTTKT